jgi:serine/threonine protein kinase
MEYMSRGSLYSQLTQQAFSFEQKKQIALDIATGLHYLHTQGIVHRDLKTANVLLDKQGNAKLTDFGLSQSLSRSLKSLGRASSDLAWQAPECLSRGKSTTASDVYSLGMILWELFTDKRPYADKTQAAIVKLVQSGQREDLSGLDAPLAQLIESCWSEDPLARPGLPALLKKLRAYEPPELPDPETLYQSGVAHERAKRYPEAFQDYLAAAQLKHMKANTNLAFCYLTGQGTPANKKEAQQRFTHSAEQGHLRAMVNLARMYEKGDGIPVDIPHALHWYTQASNLGDLASAAKVLELQPKPASAYQDNLMSQAPALETVIHQPKGRKP